MNTAHRATTTLHDVRDFLHAQGADLAPWTPAAETVEALLALLRQRRDDEAFWTELAGLLEQLEDARVRPELIRGAEVLDGAAAGELLTALRRALPQVDAPAGDRSWLRGASAAKVLAAVLLLGTAVGCPPNQGVVDDCSIEDQELTESEQIYCELVGMVDDAGVSSGVANDVLDCLPMLSTVRREQLVEEFRSLTDQELAEALQDLAWSQECDDGSDGGDH